MNVAEMDGYPGGWIGAILDTGTGHVTYRGFPTFAHRFIGLAR